MEEMGVISLCLSLTPAAAGSSASLQGAGVMYVRTKCSEYGTVKHGQAQVTDKAFAVLLRLRSFCYQQAARK